MFKIICSETEAVLQDPSFEEVELSTLTAILEQDDLTVSSELELFNAAQRWATRECVRKGMSLVLAAKLKMIAVNCQGLHTP